MYMVYFCKHVITNKLFNMKKLFLLLIAICSITVNGICNSDGDSSGPTREEILIKKSEFPPIPRPRSVINFIEAYLNRADSTIEVYFNYMFGEVTVTVEDASGNTVSTQICDTDSEEVIRFAAPEAEGEYIIKIAGQDLYAEGSFAI